MISKMLQNETYTGTLVQGKYRCDGKRHKLLPKEQWIRHENTHPAIVGREQFESVQALMLETAAKYERGKGPSLAQNCYSGKVFCKRCGKVITRGTGGRVGHTRFYFCCRYCVDDIKAETGLTRISTMTVAALDVIVMKSLKDQIDLLIDFDKLARQLSKAGVTDHKKLSFEKERQKWESAVKDADKTLSTAYAHHLDGLLDSREFGLVREMVERDRLEASVKLQHIETELARHDGMTERHSHWRRLYDSFRTVETPTKELVQALVSRIELTPLTNEIDIIMNYSDGLAEYRDMICECEVSVGA